MSGALRYLHFDASEGGDDSATFDAMASAPPSGLSALQAELCRVLGWAHRQFPGQRGPLDEGGTWDFDLQASQERTRAERLDYDEASGRLRSTLADGEALRHTVSLSLSGGPAFAEAFRAAFPVDAD